MARRSTYVAPILLVAQVAQAVESIFTTSGYVATNLKWWPALVNASAADPHAKLIVADMKESTLAYMLKYVSTAK